MKFKIQGILASLLAVSLLACPAFAKSFPDVSKDSAYSTAVAYVSELGVMVGDNQGNFNPDKIVNRAEMAAIVCRVLGQTENLSKTTVFTDVPTTHWANANIGKASELKIVNGYGGGKFGPGDPVTYEQAITMIVRAIGEGDKAASYGGYPNGFLQVAQEKNLLNGIQATQGQGLSRGAVAVLLYNYYTTQNNPGTSSDGHTHNWATRHVDEVGHMASNGTHTVLVTTCDCGMVFSSDDPDCRRKYNEHHDPMGPNWAHSSTQYTIEVPNGDSKWVVDIPAHDETYCTICGVIK